MIGIAEIASYIPADRESNLDKLDKFGINLAFIDDKIGVHEVSRRAPGEGTTELCLAAYAKLRAKHDFDPASVDCIAVCTQNPDGHGLPHVSAVLHGRLGLGRRCASFDIGLGCSGFVYSLSIVKSFMEAHGFRRGLLFTADPYSKIVDPDDKNTALLFGDGATASLLEHADAAHPILVPVRFEVDTNGALSNALCIVDGKLRMNGRRVFEYSATAVPESVRSLMAAANLSVGDIDAFLFHQGSKYIVDALIKRLDLPPEKVPNNLRDQGNTVSSTIPLLLEPMVHDPRVRRVLACGFGVGLSTATCVLERLPASGPRT